MSIKSHLLAKIGFLEDQLESLTHYLPETYQYLMVELDLQKRQLAEVEVSETFQEIDKDQFADSKKHLNLNQQSLALAQEKFAGISNHQ